MGMDVERPNSREAEISKFNTVGKYGRLINTRLPFVQLANHLQNQVLSKTAHNDYVTTKTLTIFHRVQLSPC